MQSLAMPVDLPIWALVSYKAARPELRTMLGQPHDVETDPRRTCGGGQDGCAYKLLSGQRILVVLDVTTGRAELYGDPPQVGSILQALGIAPDDTRLKHHEPFEMT
jgi:hypothetical protein